MSQYLFLLLVLACPLMMIFMMRGHGHGGSRRRGDQAGRVSHDGHDREEGASVDDLRRRRDELDRQIGEHERQGATSVDRSVERV